VIVLKIQFQVPSSKLKAVKLSEIHHFWSVVIFGIFSWDLGLGTWDLGLGTWNLELGTWNLELGTWNLELLQFFKSFRY